jgi:hypothetical protein
MGTVGKGNEAERVNKPPTIDPYAFNDLIGNKSAEQSPPAHQMLPTLQAVDYSLVLNSNTMPFQMEKTPPNLRNVD